jgi:hypothetical protein
MWGGTEGGGSWYLQRSARQQHLAHDSSDEMALALGFGPVIMSARSTMPSQESPKVAAG